jgi:hypothetical protein
MDAVVEKHNATAVRKVLENLPKEVDETYDEVMERIEQQNEADRTLAKRVLSWVTHACRPLDVDELQHALAIVDGTILDHESITDEEILTSVCAGLVVVDGKRTIVRLVRKSSSCFSTKQATVAYSPQITQHSNTSNAGEKLCFRVLMPAWLGHASRTFHSTSSKGVTSMITRS